MKAPDDYPKKAELKQFKKISNSSDKLFEKDDGTVEAICIADGDQMVGILTASNKTSQIILYDRVEKSIKNTFKIDVAMSHMKFMPKSQD